LGGVFFFFNNQKTGIDVAQARGAILYTLQRRGIIIHEFTPLEVKR
jgi:crossover junction endodeoxyribonuclease RuvC